MGNDRAPAGRKTSSHAHTERGERRVATQSRPARAPEADARTTQPAYQPLKLLQQSNLPRVVKLMLHNPRKQVIEVVVALFLPRDLVSQARIRKSRHRLYQFVMSFLDL